MGVECELWQEAQQRLVGGVNSPVRAFKAVGGSPLFVARAAGARFEDEDGRSFIDYVGSWGPMILGHAHPAVVDAVAKAAAGGLSFGAPTPSESELAHEIIAEEPLRESAYRLAMRAAVARGDEAEAVALAQPGAGAGTWRMTMQGPDGAAFARCGLAARQLYCRDLPS